MIEILMLLDEFCIEIADEKFYEIRTVQDSIDYITMHPYMLQL